MKFTKRITIVCTLMASFTAVAQTTQPAFNVDEAMSHLAEANGSNQQQLFQSSDHQNLGELQNKINELLQTYAPSHPLVIKARNEYAASYASQLQKLQSDESLANQVMAVLAKRRDSSKTDMQTMLGNISFDTLQPIMQSLSQQRETLKLQAAGDQARLSAITAEIGEARLESKVKSADDPILTSLQKALEIRQKQLDRTAAMVSQGQASPADQDKADADVSEIRIRIAERQKELVTSTTGDLIPAFTKEAISLRIEEAERQAKLDYIQHRLVELAKAQEDFQTSVDADSQIGTVGTYLSNCQSAIKQLSTMAPAAEPTTAPAGQ